SSVGSIFRRPAGPTLFPYTTLFRSEQMLEGAGASMSSMPSSEAYNGMQQGIIDALNTSSSSFVSFRIYEQVGCYTPAGDVALWRSEEHTSELQSRENLVCRLPLEQK